jgi:type IV secretion system protein TrbI
MTFSMTPKSNNSGTDKGRQRIILLVMVLAAGFLVFSILQKTDKKKADKAAATAAATSSQSTGFSSAPATITQYKKDLSDSIGHYQHDGSQTDTAQAVSSPNAYPVYGHNEPPANYQSQQRTLPPTAYSQPGYAPHSLPESATTAGPAQPNPVEQQRVELARDREKKLYADRYASSVALSKRVDDKIPASGNTSPLPAAFPPPVAFPPTVPQPAAAVTPDKATTKPKHPEHEPGTFYIPEGTSLDTVLETRLDGTFAGPVKVMVTNPVYDRSREMILIPTGSVLLGEIKPVTKLGEERLAVSFHRLLRPDGYTVDLDKFVGLDQIGETALKDKVNHHYIEVFGTSVALAAISGLSTSTSNTGFNSTGFDQYRQGFGESLDQSATRILDKYTNILPTITIREGTRVKVYFTNDLYVPPANNAPILD